MVSTGIEALDARLGTLVAGRQYIFYGPSGSGKTSVALHFLGAGLEEGEVCAILSQEDPADLVAHAEHLGYDFRQALERDRLRVVRFRLDFLRNYSRTFDPSLVFEELNALLGTPQPTRLVIDSLMPFLDGGHYVDDLIDGMGQFLADFPGTVYLTIPTELGDLVLRRIYHRLTSTAAGVFELKALEGRSREFRIQKLRQSAKFMDPFQFVIRPGVGVVEEVSWEAPDELSEDARRRVVLLDEGGTAPDELRTALGRMYDLTPHDTVEEAFADLASGQYGVLLITLDPLAPDAVFHLIQSLRRAGTGVPILLHSPSERLRASTRARALRIGADDFLTDTISPQEILERIEGSRRRGHRRAIVPMAPEAPRLQPVDDGGAMRMMTESELRGVIAERLTSDAEPFFVLAILDPGSLGVAGAWELLRKRVRVREGDLIATLSGGRVGVFLHDLYHEQGAELVSRFEELHPELGERSVVSLYRHPADHDSISTWLAETREIAEGVPAKS